MADTTVKQLMDAVVAALDGAPKGALTKPTGLFIGNQRRRVFEEVDLPRISAIVVRDSKAEEKGKGMPAVHRKLTVGLFFRCIGSTDDDVEPLRAWAHQQLMVGDRSLGGIALDTDDGDVEWLTEVDSDSDFIDAGAEYVIDYVRPKNTL